MQKTVEENVLELADVSFSYGEVPVLSDVTFSIKRGEYVGIIGPNGAGKTTLLRLILGLLTPSKGSIKFFGVDAKRFKQWSRIGYVPQRAAHFDDNFPATVFDVVIMGRYGKRGLFHKIIEHDKKHAEAALKQVGMWELRERLISELSGGQQQRVFIARALASDPEIIFLDEPMVGVDQKTKEDFYRLLKKFNEELKITIILISHDLGMLLNEVSSVICIDGKLVCHDSPTDFLKDTKSHAIFGGGINIITHDHNH